MHQLFSNRRILYLTGILIVSNILITGVSLFVIYNKSISSLKTSLVDIVERQKSLVTVLHDQGNSGDKIIRLINTMEQKHRGIGKTGEFVIACKSGDTINFLLSGNNPPNFYLDNTGKNGWPMRMAFKGKTGYVFGKDYNGVDVLAVYSYVPELKWGIVAKINTSEVYKPYYNAIEISVIISVILLSFWVYLFFKISNTILNTIIQSEEKFRRAIHSAPFPIMIHAEDGEVMGLSQGWTDISGYSLSDIPTIEDWTQRAYGVRKHTVKEEIDTLYRLENRNDEGEYFITCKDGLERIWDFSSASLGNLIDGRRAVISMAKDVTERKLAEEALKLSEERLNLTLQVTQIGTWDWNVKDDIWFASPIYYTMLGYDPVSDPSDREIWVKRIHPDDRSLVYEKISSVLSGESSDYQYEARMRHADGTYKWHSVIGNVVERDDNNKPIRLIGVRIDISDRKKAEYELRDKTEEIEAQNEEYRLINEELYVAKEKAEENEKKYKVLFDTLAEGVAVNEMIMNEHNEMIDYQIVEVNPAFYKTADIANKEIIGNVASKVYGMSTDYIKSFWQNHKNLCETAFTEMVSPLNNRNFYISTSPFINNRFVTSFFDITNLKKSEQLLKERNEQLLIAKEKAEESDRLKTAFIQNISHEIRTPMNAIMGFSELLINQFNNKTKLEYYSQIINQRSADLLDIINEILDIAKIESGQLPVHFEECKLNFLFSELSVFFKENQKKLNKEHIKFNIETNSNFPDSVIITDKVKLKQIFINIIGNAFKFTEEGEITAGCKLNEDNKLVFFVSDTGIGIPPDKQDQIFERFAQLNYGNNRLYGGTGLGLSIVKGLINLLGGDIWLESEPNKGSTFYFTLSYETTNKTQLEQTIVHKQTGYNFSNKTILIVEDDAYNAEYLKEVLSDTGIEILYSVFGREAIEISLSKSIDMVLMDIGLPDMNGYDVTRQILLHKPELKIVAQTAYAAPDDKQKAFDAGCVDYISKPIKRDLLLQIMNKYFISTSVVNSGNL